MESNNFSINELQTMCKTEITRNQQLHQHDFYTVFWIQKGEAIHATKYIEYTVNEGNAFFVPAGLVHRMILSDNCQGIGIQFTKSFLEIASSCSSEILQSSLFNNPDFYTIIALESDSQTILSSIIHHIFNEFTSNKPEKNTILGIWLSLLLHQAKRLHTTQYIEMIEHNSENINHTLIKFKQLIEDNYTATKEVSFYAEKLGISTSCLNETSKKITGITAGEIIRNRIISEAKKLLYSTSLNSKQISYQLGFEDPAYFSRFFKKYTSTTMHEFRNATMKKYNKNTF